MTYSMLRPLRLLLCASAAALILGAAAGGDFAFVAPVRAQADVAFIASIAPPPLPAYSQPAIPGPGYMWIPGYWGWNGAGYYWVPGYWALPPAAGLLWTPGYWAWSDTDHDYVFHSGYWAPTVGYYGGINYGFGYTGEGYQGGYWRNRQFYYNRAVNDLGTAHVASYANQAFAPANHISFNGGRGGTTARPNISLPLAHSVAGARKNGPFVNNSASGNPQAGVSHGPTAPTGAVRNFAQPPATTREPAIGHNFAAGHAAPAPATHPNPQQQP